MSILRYPGGKSKIRPQLVEALRSLGNIKDVQYREPFLGGGSVCIAMLECGVDSVWINDRDPGIAALWTSVIRHPEALCERIASFEPSVDSFYEMKERLKALTEEADESSVVDVGFSKLALHQISYSGLGTMSGSPLGGVQQKSQYKIGCRWYPDTICKKIRKFTELFKAVEVKDGKCTCLDFESVLSSSPEHIAYIDPPYYHKGNDLYQFGFTNYDHLRLSKTLRKSNSPWLVSYDDCEEIRDLYSWACVEGIEVPYTINASKDTTGKKNYVSKGELFIKRCK